MNVYRIAICCICCIISCLYVNATESNNRVILADHTYIFGEYSEDDYKKYPAYKEIIVKALEKDNNGPPMLAYILQNQSYVVCIYGDALGRLIYVAKCYQLTDAEHYKKIGEILYVNRHDFEIPELKDGFLKVRSKGSRSILLFDIHQNSSFAEDLEDENLEDEDTQSE